ncbi:MAG: putative porin [Nitrobacter sp.]|uniref:porin n=1 Tax=Nitrobacter sp. TaxID=29420 RepID=UPI00387DED27
MKWVKGFFIGSAAVLVVSSGAQAADLPLKAKAVEYVKVCSLYGAGFYYIPGTDTCIKLGGYLRADMGINTNLMFAGNTVGAGGAQNRFGNAFTWRSRADLNVDTRTATEYGVVRTYMETVFSWTSGGWGGSGNGTTTYAGGDIAAGGQLGVYYAFIQFAGFTMGKAVSQFSTPWGNYLGYNIFDGLVGGGGGLTGVNQFTYTAELGNGMSGSIGVQDPTQYYQAGILNLGVAPTAAFGTASLGYGANDYGGTTVPDIVGRFRVEQAWGSFQVSVAAHDNNPAYYTDQASGGPRDKWGWAGQLALSINNIPTGPGDTIDMQSVFTNGATRYNIQDLAAAAGVNTIYTGVTGIGYGFAPDAVFGPGGQLQLVSTWGMRGAFNHNWNEYWASSIFGAYASVSYSGAAKTFMCGVTIPAAIGLGVTTCNPDYNIGQIGANVRWTPVRNLTFTTEALYTMLDQKYQGAATLVANPAIGKPAGSYNLTDQSTWTVMFRAQRSW